MSFFSRTFGRADAPLHVAAHSHHPWPDVSYDAQIAAWEDAARLLDRKWDHVFEHVIPKARAHIARQLNLPDPATIAFGPNTHAFLMRILSCLPQRPVRVLTTGSEFMSFSRQMARLKEDGLVSVTQISTEPFEDFAERFAHAASRGGHNLVFLSQVFFDSGFAVHDLAKIVRAVPHRETFVVIDGYHGFMALPTDLAAIADRAFYLAGGYKYAMAGEGACFLHCPPSYGQRPLDTGWYAGFSALESGGKGEVAYATDGSRFLGATFDVSALYRFNAVQDWLAGLELSVDKMLLYVRALERAFLRETKSDDVSAATLVVPNETERGRFLCFRTPKAGAIVARLAEQNIIADHRGDRLRIGFGLYHSQDAVRRLAAALG
ncbi:MAG: aminotransferase class V-fold PLP-dependent enzyme [Alphaproteobacteria bacterium]|nr:aminotransferase class V-fold PLP-dependent enzyme [Alphaproteobacteria bacterium]MBL6939404.1 aminotransferase class V-fold PLP-dependent enzyme [Alphaproteobacteria bacterium]MBL7097115.1 aminotransferase class V-fold PLP-dependent enzyme [Alphaproteobacteria bacterium]